MEIIQKIEVYDAKVKRAVASKQRRVLFKQGAYLRTTMQRSFRVSKRRSKPGESPRVRSSKSPLRQLVRFHVDLDKGEVVCGPERFSSSKVDSSKPLPELLDKGGTFEQMLKSGKSVMRQVLPRPFTAPVFSDGGKKFRELIEKEEL